jgi:YVTN family beta-propeller protein
VKDEFGNGVADATVTFTVTAGGGAVAASSARTNATGTASVGWTLGPGSGAQTLSAIVGALPAVTFAATATPDVPASIRFAPSDPIVGVGYSQQLSGSAVDRFGNATTTPVSLSVGSGAEFFTLSAGGLATGTSRGTGSVLATAGSLTAAQAISIVDPWSRFGVPARPFGVAVSGTSIFVTQLDAAFVSRLQLTPFATFKAAIAVGQTPTDVAVNPSGTIALVSNQSDGSVGVIDLTTNLQTRTITAGGSTFRVITSADGTRGYATQVNGQLIVVDLATSTSRGSIVIPVAANGLAMGPGDTLVYVSSVAGNIAVVNVRLNAVARTINVPGMLQDLAISADAATLYVAHEDVPRVDVVSLATGTVTSQIAVPFAAFGLKLSPDGRTLYVTHPAAGRVTALDSQTGLVMRSYAVGGIPRRISFDRATGRAVVSNEGGWLDYLFLP